MKVNPAGGNIVAHVVVNLCREVATPPLGEDAVVKHQNRNDVMCFHKYFYVLLRNFVSCCETSKGRYGTVKVFEFLCNGKPGVAEYPPICGKIFWYLFGAV